MTPRLNDGILSYYVEHYVRHGDSIYQKTINATLARIILLQTRYLKCLPFLQNASESRIALTIRGSELTATIFNSWRIALPMPKLLVLLVNRLYSNVKDLVYQVKVSGAVKVDYKLVCQTGNVLKRTKKTCELLDYSNRTCDKVLMDLLSNNMVNISATGLNIPPFIHHDDVVYDKLQVFSYVPSTGAARNPYLGPFFSISAKNMELPQAGLNVLYEYLPLPQMPLLETLTVGFKCIETSPPPSTKLYTQIMNGLKEAAPGLKELALKYRLLIDSRKITKHLQQLELVMSKVKYVAEGIQLSKIPSSGIEMEFDFSTVIERDTISNCKSEFNRIFETDNIIHTDWTTDDDDFFVQRHTFKTTIDMFGVDVKIQILVEESQFIDQNMDLLEKICEPI
ncbi:unnamed protein product [Bursaphelenchus okinawaensis]|uniref:Uncharacterized protein n=1 Tax=Bursaphelenchus okinawaensis TaxID=465554 RepID=A0A811JQB7_9BILA|nr:unnamed protein product [Bursaphelenchus okinawaensis]CAG9077898.1 unnamed protein product [Bursaphelenchus okinawaensis]